MNEEEPSRNIFEYDSFENIQTLQDEGTKITALLLSCLNKLEIIILKAEVENPPILTDLYQFQQCIIEIGKCIEEKNSEAIQRENSCSNIKSPCTTLVSDESSSIVRETIVTPRIQGLDEIAGLWEIKKLLKSFVILPRTQPQLFTYQKAFNSILLFGPPGTGKTHLVHALAYEAKAILYSITTSNIITPLVGQSEKNIQVLFQHIRNSEGFSILFIDELDGFCKKRSDSEQDHTRRIKTELMCQMSEIENNSNMFLICATNCPWDLDTAFLRRFQKRIYVPLPNPNERIELFQLFTRNASFNIDNEHWEYFVDKTEGFSGSDVSHLIQYATNIPILELQDTKIWKITSDGFYEPITKTEDFKEDDIVCKELHDLPPCSVRVREVDCVDLVNALDKVTYTVSKADIKKYELFITQ